MSANPRDMTSVNQTNADLPGGFWRSPIVERRLRNRVSAREVRSLRAGFLIPKIPMICSSVHRFFFIVSVLQSAGL
nr:hypothetical protein [Methylosinus sp. R-45379]